jgi:O-antigen/teichoic acid export membrane protein
MKNNRSSALINFISIIISIFGIIIVVLFTFLKSRELSPYQLGFLTLLLSYGSIFSVFSLVGPSYSLTKYLDTLRTYPTKLSFLLFILLESFIINLFISFFLFLVSPYFQNIILFDFFIGNFIIIFLNVILSVTQSHLTQFFKFTNKPIISNILDNVVFRLLNLTILFLYISDFFGFITFINLILISHLIVILIYIGLLILDRDLFKASFKLLEIGFIKKVLRYSFIMFFSNGLMFILSYVDVIVLSIFLPIEFIGLFSVALFLSSFITIIDSSLSIIALPKLVFIIKGNLNNELNDSYNLNLNDRFYFGFFAFISLIILNHYFIDFFPYDYQLLFLVTVLLLTGKFINYLFGFTTEILIYSKKTLITIIFNFIHLTTSIAILFYFLPRFSVLAATIPYFFSSLVLNSIKYIYVKNKFKISYPFRKFFSYLLISAFLTGYFFLLQLIFKQIFILLPIYFVSSLITYDLLILFLGLYDQTFTHLIGKNFLMFLKNIKFKNK